MIEPTAGRVVDLKATTIGGVVGPGEPILDLLPSQAELLVEARLPPATIKDVRRGLPARVVLTAYPQRNLPIVHGVVREVVILDESEADRGLFGLAGRGGIGIGLGFGF